MVELRGGTGTRGTRTPLKNVLCASQQHTRAHGESRLDLSLSPSADTGPETKEKAKEGKEKGERARGREGRQALFYCSFIPLHSVAQRQ